MSFNDASNPIYTVLVGGSAITSSVTTNSNVTASIISSVPLNVTASILGGYTSNSNITASIISSIPLNVTASILGGYTANSNVTSSIIGSIPLNVTSSIINSIPLNVTASIINSIPLNVTASILGGSSTSNTTSSIINPVIITGYANDGFPLTGSPVLIGSKVIDITTYTASYTTKSIAALSVDKSSGALLVTQGSLTPTYDGVGIYGYDGTTWRPSTIISASLAKSPNSQVILIQPVDVNGNIGSNVGGFTLRSTSSFTRPSDTASYISGDVISNSTSTAITNIIPNVVRTVGGSGTILNAALVDGANQPILGNFEVYLFNTNRVSENDNTSFSASYNDGKNLISVIQFTPSSSFVLSSGSAGTTIYFDKTVCQPFVCSPGTSSLYWNLVSRNSYTPTSGEQFTLKLNISAD